MNKAVLTAGIFAGLSLAIAFSSQGQIEKNTPQPAVSNEDSLRNKQRAAELKVLEEKIRQAENEIEKARESAKNDEGEMKTAELEIKRAGLEMQRANLEMEEAMLEMKEAEKEMAQMEIEMKLAEKEMAMAEKEMAHAAIEMEKAGEEMKQAELEIKEAEKEIEKFNAIHAALLKELKEATGEEITSYEITGTTLLVNGKKQDQELQQRISKKYLDGLKVIKYTHDPKNGRTTIHTE